MRTPSPRRRAAPVLLPRPVWAPCDGPKSAASSAPGGREEVGAEAGKALSCGVSGGGSGVVSVGVVGGVGCVDSGGGGVEADHGAQPLQLLLEIENLSLSCARVGRNQRLQARIARLESIVQTLSADQQPPAKGEAANLREHEARAAMHVADEDAVVAASLRVPAQSQLQQPLSHAEEEAASLQEHEERATMHVAPKRSAVAGGRPWQLQGEAQVEGETASLREHEDPAAMHVADEAQLQGEAQVEQAAPGAEVATLP